MATYQNQSYDDQSYYQNYEADQNQNEAGEQEQDAGDKNWSWGDEEWADTDEVRIVSGEQFEPWKTFDQCTGDWKYPAGLMQFLIDAGFRCPTPIQAYTWPPLMDGTDVIGVAKTGSGKTLGYLLPGYIKVKRKENEGFQFDYTTGPAMLVLAPTRELCLQISEESVRFGTPAQIQTACVYGGQPKSMQAREIWKGPQCIAATPGRLNDFLKEKTIKLGACGYFVLDEADRMLDMGFQPQIEEVLEYLPRDRQNAFFTATWPSDVRAVARKVCDRDCTHIQVGSSENTSNKDITQHVRLVYSDRDKMAFLQDTLFKRLMETGGSALIFCKTKRSTTQMFQQLKGAGAPIVQLHGDLEQHERDMSLKAFKEGRAKVLIATDVAQRGLDIKNVQMVVNYDPPATLEDYTHRIGRTGRAGEKGDAYTLLLPGDSAPAGNIMKAMKKTGQSIPNDLKTVAHGSAGAQGGQEEFEHAARPNGGNANEGSEEITPETRRDTGGATRSERSDVSAAALDLQSCGKDFEFACWKGSALLKKEMGDYAVENLPNPQRLAEISVNKFNLEQLHKDLELPVHRDGGRKARADYVEALFWKLDENGCRDLKKILLESLASLVMEDITDGGRLTFAAMYKWIGSFEVPKGSDFTHSSLRGARDWCTSSGRLAIRSTRNLEVFHRCIAEFHKQASPLCFVEMQTAHHYLSEDIDVRGDRGFFLPAKDMNFWNLRATILYAMFPETNPLQLTLYTASGWDTGKSEYKSSFHAIWSIVVDANRHASVRTQTIGEFTRQSTTGLCERWQTAMLQANDANTWEAVFDVSMVKGGSGRLPFCDKTQPAARHFREKRPLIPVGVWEFHFEPLKVLKLFGPRDLSEEEWVRRGSVRQIDDEGNMPPLTHYRPFAHQRVPKLPQSWKQQQQQRGRAGPGGRWNDLAALSSSSMRNMKASRDEKEAKAKKAWVGEQRNRRRVFCNTYGCSAPEALAKAFKQQLDRHMRDPDGDLSTLAPTNAKTGNKAWLWTTKWLKGAVEIVIPQNNFACANLFVRGNSEQQAHYIEVLKQFTEPWEGEVPPYKGKGGGVQRW